PITQTEVRLVFKRPPRLGFVDTLKRAPEPAQLIIKLDPSTGVRLRLDAQIAGGMAPEPIHLDMEFAQEGGEGATPYDELLSAAMRGDSTSVARQDSVVESWRGLQPPPDSPPPPHPSAPRSARPHEAR